MKGDGECSFFSCYLMLFNQIVVMVETRPSSVHLKKWISYMMFNSQDIASNGDFNNVWHLLLFSAVVPVIKVVAAVILVLALPLAKRACLMWNEDALLELGVEVLAAVASVHGNQHSVELLLRVFLRLEHVVRDRSLEIEECHLYLLL